ncbi:MAG: DNA alkylation repair protein [Mucilaginibacter polytrichastri]|nr:DNA alkylation repair protein [Mucilaginibacter polytrichastri]
MTLSEALGKLEAAGNEKMRQHNRKFGAGENQYGVKMGDIRAIAKPIKTDHPLALELWKTGNVDAQFLAILIMDVKVLSAADVEKLVQGLSFPHVADWLYANVIKNHPDKEHLRKKWMESTLPMAARMGWSLTSGRVAREPEGMDLPALLDRIEREMPGAASETQWTMNTTLAQIGIHHPEYRERALAIGERLGIYRDYPTSKGCTSPFAPIWISEMVRRQG